jgi:CDP-diacylglycerol--glycerol-3-phosphate 3-phosphatidyltransferase
MKGCKFYGVNILVEPMLRDIPNMLTLARIVAVPIFVLAFYLSGSASYVLTSSIFAIASLTDYFDGMLARRWEAQSGLGRMLDPIADKLLVATALMMLVEFNRVHVLPAILILCREVLVSGLREYLSEFRVSIPVSKLGKVKTTIQMIAITIILLGTEGSGIKYLTELGNIAMWVAAFLTIITGYAYCKEGIRYAIKENMDNGKNFK